MFVASGPDLELDPAQFPQTARQLRHDHNIGSDGGGAAHINMQPFAVVNQINGTMPTRFLYTPEAGLASHAGQWQTPES